MFAMHSTHNYKVTYLFSGLNSPSMSLRLPNKSSKWRGTSSKFCESCKFSVRKMLDFLQRNAPDGANDERHDTAGLEQDVPGSADDEEEPILALLAQIEEDSVEMNDFGIVISALLAEVAIDSNENADVGVTVKILLAEDIQG